LDILLGHVIVSRAETKRYVTLPDFALYDCPATEGPTECKAVVIIMNQGIDTTSISSMSLKTNEPAITGKTINGTVEYGGMMRSRDVETCGVGALAMYFFSLYHSEGVKFPNFSERRLW
jgi:hypothetical protein